MKKHPNRREFLAAIGITAGCLLASSKITSSQAQSPDEKESPKKPNLLFIITDQQPIAGVGAYNRSVCKTPYIDSIAKNGTRFDQCHIAAFPCCPSRASIFTGLYAHRHGVTTNEIPLDENIPSMGKIFKNNGYSTAYIGKWHLGGNMYREMPQDFVTTQARQNSFFLPPDNTWYLRQVENPENYKYEKLPGGSGEDLPMAGWDHWIGGWKHYKQHIQKLGLTSMLDDPWLGGHMNGANVPNGDDEAHMHSRLSEEHHIEAFLADSAVSFLTQHKDSNNPFALALSFFAPHHPVSPPTPWDDMYSLDDVSLPENFHDDMTTKPPCQLTGTYKGNDWSTEQFKDYIRRYWGYCSYVDHQVGKLLTALKQTGQYDNTIIVFTSDHGDFVASHKNIHKNVGNGYDELFRVPLLVQWNKHLPSDASSDALVSSIDLLPTLLELAGIEPPADIDGKSFAGVLTRKTNRHRDILFATSMFHNFVAATQKWKFNLNYFDLQAPNAELYDRIEDPNEMKNLITDTNFKKDADAMAQNIFNWLETTSHPYLPTVKKAYPSQSPSKTT